MVQSVNNILKKKQKEFSLGLDLGTNSVGWSVVELKDSKPHQLINCGSRIFNKSVKDKTPTPKNVKRREARSQRRVIARHSRRVKRCERYLKKHLLMLPANLTIYGPDREQILNDLGCPYMLRAKALDEGLEAYDIGRIMLHLCQRRGFLSNKKTLIGDLADDPDVAALLEDCEDEEIKTKEDSEYKQSIVDLKNNIEAGGYRTLGEYLYKSPDLVNKRNRDQSPVKLITDRSMYLKEFDAIWSAQTEKSEYFKDNTDKLEEWKESLENIIFYQRPLKLKKNRVGKCTFETHKKRCSKARLEYQQFRYLQDINNLQYIEAESSRQHSLSIDQKTSLIPLFTTRKLVSYAGIRKALGFDSSYSFNLERAENKKLKGDQTSITICKEIPERWPSLSYKDKTDLVEDILSFQKKSALKKRLMSDRWNFNSEDAIKLCLIELEESHSNLSLKAINKILPHLQMGLIYEDAVEAAGYNSDLVKLPTLDLLPPSPDISNPIVKRSLSELRRVVNALIKEYGKPSVIRLEMAKDLEMNTKRFKKHKLLQNKNTAANIEAEKAYAEFIKNNPIKSSRIDKSYKLKHRLWLEQFGLCAYSNKKISLKQLFSSQTCLSHILPLSYSLDDSYMNKVLCFTSKNIEKGQRTPYDAFNGNKDWDSVCKNITYWGEKTNTNKTGKSYLYAKIAKFHMRTNELSSNNATASLNDTRYITKEAVAFLERLGVNVSYTRSKVAGKIRRDWGLNGLLDNPEKDHRQHAIDASIIACVDENFYNKLIARLDEIEKQKGYTSYDDLHLEEPWPTFSVDIKDNILDLTVSHETSCRIKGALHESTGYGYKDKIGVVYRKPINPDFPVDDVVDKNIKEILTNHLEAWDNKKSVAFAPDKPVFHKDGKTQIKRVRIIKKKVTLKKLEQEKFGVKDVHGRIFKWHTYGNTHCVHVYKDADGDYTSKYVTVMEAAQKQKDVHQPLFTLYKNDTLSILNDFGVPELVRVVGLNFSSNRISVGNINVNGKEFERSLGLNTKTINALDLKKVSVNVLGVVKDTI